MLYLHCIDQQQAYFDARKWFEKMNQAVAGVGIEAFQTEVDYQLLYRALLKPGSENPTDKLFNNVAHLRAELTPNEALFLLEEHRTLQGIEADEWVLDKADPHMRQIARLLEVDEATEPDAIVVLIRQRLEADADGE